MIPLTISDLQAQALSAMDAIGRIDTTETAIVGGLLSATIVLSLASIWKNRTARTPRLTSTANSTANSTEAPSIASGFTRWLTPMGMKSIPAAQAVVARVSRSGSPKSMKVSTPVSKVSARSLKSVGANELEIARRSGLSRDAVAMMMANADARVGAHRPSASSVKAASKAPTRTISTDRAMSAPGARSGAGRGQPEGAGRTLGTQFMARLG